MNPFDRFLASALETVIRKELGQRTFKKVEKRIFEKYNLKIGDAVKSFHEIDAVLREYFGKGADKIEKQFLDSIIGQKKEESNAWITIYDQKLTALILESFGDPEKKKILEQSFKQPHSITSVLETCDIPKTSGYRITKDLIENGLLVKTSDEFTKDGRNVGIYASLFKRVKIDIESDNLSVQVQMRSDFLKTSNIINALRTIK